MSLDHFPGSQNVDQSNFTPKTNRVETCEIQVIRSFFYKCMKNMKQKDMPTLPDKELGDSDTLA